MQRHRECHRHPLPRELLNRGNQADRGDGNIARAHTETLWRGIDEAMQGADHRLVIGQRLTHSHEHDVRQRRGSTGERSISACRLRVANLIDDLRRRQVTSQAHLPRRTERTRHAATGLRGHAQGGALRVAHEHRLHLGPVVQPPQILDRAAAVRLQRDDLRHERRQESLAHLGTHASRNVTHALRVGLEVREVVARELIRTERGQPQVLEHLLAPGRVEISQVRGRLAPALSGEGQDGLRVLMRRPLRRLIARAHLSARAQATLRRGRGLLAGAALRPASCPSRVAQWLDSQEIPGSAHAKMK